VNPLTAADLPSLEVFEAEREVMRRAVIAHKAARRAALGEHLTLLFEDRETIRWQVLEMCRVEGIRDPEGMAHELRVYNELVPGPRELSATLFIEITEPGRIRPELDRLIGIDDSVSLEVGAERVRAQFDRRQMEEDRISAVHYLRFVLTPEQVLRFQDPATTVALRVDHAHYEARNVLPDEVRRSLAVDLRGDPEPVHRFRARAPAAEAPVLVTRGRVRAVQPAPDRIVIEAVPPAPRFAALPDALALELLALARELSARWIAEGRAPFVVLEPDGPSARIELRARR
jgi:Protein of unknown function (DUF3501)